MSGIKEFFIQIGDWFTKLRKKFFYTPNEYMHVRCAWENQIDVNKHLLKEQQNLSERYETLNSDYSKVQNELIKHIQEASELRIKIDELLQELIPLKQTPQLDIEYYRETQIQLGRLLEAHPGFGYRNELSIPGSTSVVTGTIGEDMILPVYGRCVIDDHVTREINEAKTLREKYVLTMNYILRFGALSRMIQALIQNGCVRFILGYRESTTTYECFFQINAQNFAKDSTLVFDDTYGQGTVQVKEEPEQ